MAIITLANGDFHQVKIVECGDVPWTCVFDVSMKEDLKEYEDPHSISDSTRISKYVSTGCDGNTYSCFFIEYTFETHELNNLVPMVTIDGKNYSLELRSDEGWEGQLIILPIFVFKHKQRGGFFRFSDFKDLNYNYLKVDDVEDMLEEEEMEEAFAIESLGQIKVSLFRRKGKAKKTKATLDDLSKQIEFGFSKDGKIVAESWETGLDGGPELWFDEIDIDKPVATFIFKYRTDEDLKRALKLPDDGMTEAEVRKADNELALQAQEDEDLNRKRKRV